MIHITHMKKKYTCKQCLKPNKCKLANTLCSGCDKPNYRWGDPNGKRITLVHLRYLAKIELTYYKVPAKLMKKIEYISTYLIGLPRPKGVQLTAKQLMLAVYFSIYEEDKVAAGQQLKLYLAYNLVDQGYIRLRDFASKRKQVVKIVEDYLLADLIKELPRLKKHIDTNELVFPLAYSGDWRDREKDYIAPVEMEEYQEEQGHWKSVKELNKQMVYVDTLVWITEEE